MSQKGLQISLNFCIKVSFASIPISPLRTNQTKGRAPGRDGGESVPEARADSRLNNVPEGQQAEKPTPACCQGGGHVHGGLGGTRAGQPVALAARTQTLLRPPRHAPRLLQGLLPGGMPARTPARPEPVGRSPGALHLAGYILGRSGIVSWFTPSPTRDPPDTLARVQVLRHPTLLGPHLCSLHPFLWPGADGALIGLWG